MKTEINKIGGINFIPDEQRAKFDENIINISSRLLVLTKNAGNKSTDYFVYFCFHN